jgi:hypothetical protein
MSKRLRNEMGAVRSKAPTSSPDRDEMAAFVATLPKLRPTHSRRPLMFSSRRRNG